MPKRKFAAFERQEEVGFQKCVTDVFCIEKSPQQYKGELYSCGVVQVPLNDSYIYPDAFSQSETKKQSSEKITMAAQGFIM